VARDWKERWEWGWNEPSRARPRDIWIRGDYVVVVYTRAALPFHLLYPPESGELPEDFATMAEADDAATAHLALSSFGWRGRSNPHKRWRGRWMPFRAEDMLWELPGGRYLAERQPDWAQGLGLGLWYLWWEPRQGNTSFLSLRVVQ